MAGAIPWPMWPSIGLVPFGAGLITLRLAAHLIGHVLSLATGRAVIALPAAHAHRRNLRMILTLAMVVLFVLLAIGTPVGFAMAGSGVLGLYLVGGMPMLSGILQTAPLSAVTSYELITIPMFLLMAEFVLVSGIADDLFKATAAWVGEFPAGSAWRRPLPAPASARSAAPARLRRRRCRPPACPRC